MASYKQANNPDLGTFVSTALLFMMVLLFAGTNIYLIDKIEHLEETCHVQ